MSTCGLVPIIEKLSEEGLQITLAISLHAPNDIIRKELCQLQKNTLLRNLQILQTLF